MLALKSKRLIYYSLILSVCSGVNYCYATVGPLIAQIDLGLSPSAYATWNLLNILGMFLSSVIAARLLIYLSPKTLIKISFVMIALSLMGLSLLQFFHWESIASFFILTMFLFLASGFCFPAGSFYASNAVKEDKASATGMMSFINMGGATLMVIIMGYMPLSQLMAFVSIIALLMVLLLLLAVSWSLEA